MSRLFNPMLVIGSIEVQLFGNRRLTKRRAEEIVRESLREMVDRLGSAAGARAVINSSQYWAESGKAIDARPERLEQEAVPKHPLELSSKAEAWNKRFSPDG